MDDLSALRLVPLFGHMSDEDLRDVLRLMAPANFAPGEVIIREGEPGDDFFVVLRGVARIAVRAADGNELVVGEAGPGGFFGELSMLTGEPRSARVQANEAVETLTLHRDQFLVFLEKHPQAAISVLMELGHRLHRTDSLLRQAVSRNVNEMEEEQLTWGLRLVNHIASLAGSLPFLMFHTLVFCLWMIVNQPHFSSLQFDPPPYNWLALTIGIEATLLSIFVLISQNQEVAKDRLAAEIDHQINTKAEVEIGLLLQRVDDLEAIVRHHAEEQKQLITQLAKAK
jgi:uncharacterized membrane protein